MVSVNSEQLRPASDEDEFDLLSQKWEDDLKDFAY